MGKINWRLCIQKYKINIKLGINNNGQKREKQRINGQNSRNKEKKEIA